MTTFCLTKRRVYIVSIITVVLILLAAFSCQALKPYTGDGTLSRNAWYYQRPHTIKFDDIKLNIGSAHEWVIRHPPSDKMYFELMGIGYQVGPKAEEAGVIVTVTWMDEFGLVLYTCSGFLYKNIQQRSVESCWAVGGNETDFAVWSLPPFPIKFDNSLTYKLVVRVDVEIAGPDPIIVSPRLHSLPP